MEDSVFTKIINGVFPCHKIYEDDKTLAFLDIHPLVPGHTLVVPKKQVDHIYDLDDEDYEAVFATVKKVGDHLKKTLGTNRVIILVMGYDVPHAHVHLLPSESGQDFYDVIGRIKELSGAAINDVALAEMAGKVRL